MNATNPTTEERKALTAVMRAAQAMAEINSQMPVGEFACFLAVALNPEKGPQEYGIALGVPDSTTSRWLLDLSTEGRGGTEVKLLAWRANPENLRRKQYTMTGKGIALVNKFLTAWERVR
jgi:DNA-binding MarR family transcriptional regulator